MHSIVRFILRFRFVFFNILFAIFALFLRKPFTNMLRNAMYGKETNYLLGIILLLAIVLETVAIAFKTKVLTIRMRIEQPEKAGTNLSCASIFILWIFHILVGEMVVLLASQALSGGDFESFSPFGIVMIFVEVIRNIFILGFMLRTIPKEKQKIPIAKDFVADIFLFYFAITAYTATWGVIANMTVVANHIAMTIANTLAAVLIFLIFYIPLNMMYHFERRQYKQTKLQQALFFGSLLLVTFSAIYPLFRM